jgi:hypothetical protein
VRAAARGDERQHTKAAVGRFITFFMIPPEHLAFSSVDCIGLASLARLLWRQSRHRLDDFSSLEQSKDTEVGQVWCVRMPPPLCHFSKTAHVSESCRSFRISSHMLA